MTKRLLRPFIILACFFNLSSYAEDITLFSDDFPGEIEKRGENDLGGIGGDIVIQALKAKKISYKLEIKPWKRAFTEALTNEDKKSFIIPLTRNKEREEKFVWASKIYEAKTIFLTMSGGKNIDSMADAKGSKIGVLAGSSYENILSNSDSKIEKSSIDAVPNDITNFKKLIGKKIDAWFTINIVALTMIKANLKAENLNESNFRIGKAIAVQEKYIATTSATSPELIKKVTDAIEAFKKTPDYKKLTDKIGK
ncbi:transporter substrate-binding domain-containing protein [Silvanigrella paludirubra]|uniref:Transporter substrate-binding domain-containing protein n=1 Tax=Silvanigrella paludirubra TaxID=2499159 RepID=A0A6N6VQQ9_9BACT|nr:transporter substrate-binding domain-containing protein [Silvanigrella paludirubra]KAB8037750.1 transporter substrate-binding domain-containing protein [Silvanigrella paludirubra]